MLTKEERIYLIKCYGIGNVSYQYAINLFHEKYPNTAVSREALRKLVLKFDETGSVLDAKKPKKKLDEDDAATVLAIESVTDNPKLSLRMRSQLLPISKSHLQRIYKENNVRPFKPQLRHTLEDGDEERRLDFSLWVGENYLADRNYHKTFFFTDEATFCTNGHVSSQNSRYWAFENPNYVIHRRSQYFQKVNVWCGIFYNQIVGPFFIEGNLNQHTYIQLLQNNLLPFLETLQPELRRNIFWQQDGCPAHSTILVRQWLTNHFGQRWMGRYGPIHFPPRSPDLTPMDFFLWGALKQKVYAGDLPHDRNLLKRRIQHAVNEINVPDTIRKVYGAFISRMEKCVEVGGGYLE